MMTNKILKSLLVLFYHMQKCSFSLNHQLKTIQSLCQWSAMVWKILNVFLDSLYKFEGLIVHNNSFWFHIYWGTKGGLFLLQGWLIKSKQETFYIFLDFNLLSNCTCLTNIRLALTRNYVTWCITVFRTQ